MSELRQAKFGHVAVLMGGLNSEREVSLLSGAGVYQALQELGIRATLLDIKDDLLEQLQQGSYDRAFIAMHGGQGEGGIVQAVLEVMGIPYSTCGPEASALCMDKLRSKIIWEWAGIPTPPFQAVTSWSEVEALLLDLTYPLAIKPSGEGSTIGVSKVVEQAGLKPAFELAAKYAGDVLIETWIEGSEYTVGIINDQALPSIHIEPHEGIYDYHAKYISAETKFHCPSDLHATDEAWLQATAVRAYKLLGGSAWGRIDVVRDHEGHFWFLEANTIPGLTTHSLVPTAAKAMGVSYADMVLAILETSLAKASGRQATIVSSS